MKQIVSALYTNCRVIIQEFVEDGRISGFTDIKINVWYNALSSICAIAMRVPEIKDNERLQEAVVYQVMRLILQRDIPIDDGARRTVIEIYDRIAPTIIDILIPGERTCGCCG